MSEALGRSRVPGMVTGPGTWWAARVHPDPVTAFDPTARTFHTGATVPSGTVDVPDTDGRLVADRGPLAAAADDYGHVVRRIPAAVLRPGSARDVVAVVGFAGRHRIPVAAGGTRPAGRRRSQAAS